ncbi:hypothetical protein [Olleya sp. R77988]|uniref:hypothetical protein n=1 Tax=Olleya sp. R77988 TaxID=3093875 RepID=UPI0037CB1120
MKKLKIFIPLFLFVVNPVLSQVLSVNKTSIIQNNKVKGNYLLKLKEQFVNQNEIQSLGIIKTDFSAVVLELEALKILTKTKIDIINDKISGLEKSSNNVLNGEQKKRLKILKEQKVKFNKNYNTINSLIFKAENIGVNFNKDAYYNNQIEMFDNKINLIDEKLIETIDFTESIDLKEKLMRVRNEKDVFEVDYEKYKKNKLKKKSWLPSNNKFFRTYFFKTHYNKENDKTELLNSLSFFKSDSIKTINTELVNDILWIGRISFSSTVVIDSEDNDGDQKKEKDVEKLINGGGNFYIDYSVPIYTNYSKSIVNFYAFANVKIATDLKGFDNNIENTTANGSLGLNFLVDLSSNENKFNFSLATSSNLHYGTNDFFENLNLDNHLFFNTNILGTITIENKYRIALRTNLASEPNIRTEKVAFGIQLIN